MRLLNFFTSAFINFFGITQPTEQARRRASWFILALFFLTLVVVAAVATLLHHVLSV